MAENRRPSQRYLSGRVKLTAKAGLGTDRHLYLSPSDAEPNLGYPGEKSVPISGTYYRLVTIPNGDTYDRYWQVDSPASLVDGISIFDEGTLVGTANSVSKINIVGSAITATASGSISTISVSPPGTDKQILFNDLDDFGAASQVFYDKGNNRLGIGISNPTQQLHLNGDFRIGGRIWDIHNQVGAAGSVLIAVGSGVSWTRSSGANVTISDTAPANALNGDLWWDSEDGDLNVYYEDADSSAWVSANANADQEDGLWKLDAIGIHTLSNVGIGTTMASVALAVGGNAIFGGALGGTGIVTATEFHGTFVGNGLAIAGVGGTWASNSAGIHTTKNVGIGSTLPNAILDVRGNSSFTGITTFNDDVRFRTANAKDILFDKSNNALEFADTVGATFGDSNDLQISHIGDVSLIRDIRAGVGATLAIGADKLILRNKDGNEPYLEANDNGSVKIYYDFIPKLETTGAGVSVYGGTTTTGLSTFASVELDSTLIDIHGQVGAARSVLTATGAGVSWGRGGSGVKIDEDPPTDNYDADLWWESDTGEMHIWYDDGSSAAWVSVSQGPAGVQGAQGAQGAQGHQGHQGQVGAQGAQGHQGQVGAQGVQGAQGRQGAQGTAGPQGAQGHQGVQGASGLAGSQGHQGHQGVQGAQGHQGVQGASGAQGVQGAQGHQGHQGVQGAQGVQGSTGGAGAQGAQGAQGVQGADGNFGGATFEYKFTTATAGNNTNITSGKLGFNNSNVTSATQLFIDDLDGGDTATDIQNFLTTIDDSTSTIKGHFRISNKLDADDFALFTISAASGQATFWTVTCAHVTGSASSFSNNEDVIITFARTGDKGDVGAQGATGAQGHQGVQGATGAQGHQGHQGVQGAAGPQGAQGAQGHQGHQGHQGVQGATGAQGHQGVQGATGTGGGTGAQGHQGVQGAQGRQGAQGVQGAGGGTGGDGAQGAQGHQGRQGAQGVQGATGGGGGQGAQGHQGVQGATGAGGGAGAQGAQGHQGNTLTYNNPANDRVITSHDASTIHAESNLTFNDTNGLYCNKNLEVTGRIRPSVGNSSSKGIFWPENPGGGSGDAAWIRYYVESGENMRFEMGTTNDTDDDIQLTAGRIHMNTNDLVSRKLRPWSDDAYDLGDSSFRWRDLYVGDIKLSNEAKKDKGGNDVDGTWGDYTIQEGENDLFLINNRNGKKYKFLLKEVD